MAKVKFTAQRLSEFACPPGKGQAFLWDSTAPGLALRVTAKGAKAYVFQSRLQDGQTIRVTIGQPLDERGRGVYSIPKAVQRARELQASIDQGQDPRRVMADLTAGEALKRAQKRAERDRLDIIGLTAWDTYCADRKAFWSDRNYADHLAFSREGGAKRSRAGGSVQAGPLRSMLLRPLAAIDSAEVTKWVASETKTRPARAALGFRLFRAFVNWCAEHDEYRLLVNADACKSKRTREQLGRPAARTDALQREQLKSWFSEVGKDSNRVASAYLQGLLITGARREELAGLKWADVDFTWKALRIRDKVEGERIIPLTPYVAHLLSMLPRRNEFVFSRPAVAAKLGEKQTGKVSAARIADARGNHVRALARAGLPHVSLHGLRRSFGTLSEWVEVPVGIVAQIQGHKPSAIAEKHYRVRPIDLLRMWHERIEAFILENAGVTFQQIAGGQRPQVVSAA